SRNEAVFVPVHGKKQQQAIVAAPFAYAPVGEQIQGEAEIAVALVVVHDHDGEFTAVGVLDAGADGVQLSARIAVEVAVGIADVMVVALRFRVGNRFDRVLGLGAQAPQQADQGKNQEAGLVTHEARPYRKDYFSLMMPLLTCCSAAMKRCAAADRDRRFLTRMPISRVATGECSATLCSRVVSIRRSANCGTAAMPTPAATIAPTTEILSAT